MFDSIYSYNETLELPNYKKHKKELTKQICEFVQSEPGTGNEKFFKMH